MMQANQHFELNRGLRTQVNEVSNSAYLQGQFDHICPGLPSREWEPVSPVSV
jgi:hypothetical protein